MAFKARIAASAATLALTAGGLGMVGTLSASATTPSCGSNCSNIYSLKFNRRTSRWTCTTAQASYGQPVILFQRSNSDFAEDFVVKDLHTVDTFYQHDRGLISPAFDQAYGNQEAYEIQYQPLGRPTNFCVGTTPYEIGWTGEKVALYPCGASASTIWAQDTTRATAPPRRVMATTPTSTARRTASPTRSC